MRVHYTEWESLNPPVIKREGFHRLKKSAEQAALVFYGIDAILKWNPELTRKDCLKILKAKEKK